MQEEWGPVDQPRGQDNHRWQEEVRNSFTLCFSLSPAQTLEIHTRPFPSEQSTAAVHTEAQKSMGESWGEHKSCPLLRWEVEGNIRGLTRKPWKFIPPPLPFEISGICMTDYSLELIFRQSCFSIRIYNDDLTQDNLGRVLALESATLALSVHFSLNSMWPKQIIPGFGPF